MSNPQDQQELEDMHDYYSCGNLDSYSDEKALEFLLAYFEQEILDMVADRIDKLESKHINSVEVIGQ